ncbi:MAG: radical SAM protein, partial [Candidatus Omnitrophota bacterium]
MTDKFLIARIREITGKIREKGIAWGVQRFFSKGAEPVKYSLDEWAHILKDIRRSGISYALANIRVQRRFNALLKDSYRYSTLRKKAPYPLHAHIEVTALCNLKCRMCPRVTMQRSQGTMTMEAFKKIIDELKRVHLPNTLFMHFTGEPLINPQLPLMIKYAKEQGLPWIKFNTNACLLTETRAKEILQSGLDCLVCAVEMSEEEENKLRPGADYNEVVRNVQRFMRLKKEMKAEKPLVKLQMLVT